MSASMDPMAVPPHNESGSENPERIDADRIWSIARALVKQKGSSAPVIAATQARKLLENGEIEERLTWMRVLAASKALL